MDSNMRKNNIKVGELKTNKSRPRDDLLHCQLVGFPSDVLRLSG